MNVFEMIVLAVCGHAVPLQTGYRGYVSSDISTLFGNDTKKKKQS